ncbi:hypothetical protein SEA_KEANU_50 [Streptomyces phage Keanu]|nr:hypothetical protein SEA_KEANU_50 [Streptomyces phage Keanu]
MGDVRDPERDQPLPEPGKVDIQLYLMRALAARRDHGIRKYGRPLESHNGRVALLDLWEELVDALLYLTQQLTEMGVPLEGTAIPEGHPAYSLVQDLIEGDGPTQDAALAKLNPTATLCSPVVRCNRCGQIRDVEIHEMTRRLQEQGWIIQAIKDLAATPSVMLPASVIRKILAGKIFAGHPGTRDAEEPEEG